MLNAKPITETFWTFHCQSTSGNYPTHSLQVTFLKIYMMLHKAEYVTCHVNMDHDTVSNGITIDRCCHSMSLRLPAFKPIACMLWKPPPLTNSSGHVECWISLLVAKMTSLDPTGPSGPIQHWYLSSLVRPLHNCLRGWLLRCSIWAVQGYW